MYLDPAEKGGHDETELLRPVSRSAAGSCVIDALKKDYKVIALDLRGCGGSGKPHDPKAYGIEMVNDVVRLLDHLKIDKAHIVGYSMSAKTPGARVRCRSPPGVTLCWKNVGDAYSHFPGCALWLATRAFAILTRRKPIKQ